MQQHGLDWRGRVDTNLFAAHEQCGDPRVWNQAKYARFCLSIAAIDLELLIGETHGLCVRDADRVESQGQIAFVAQGAVVTGYEHGAPSRRALSEENLAVHDNRIEQSERKRVAGFIPVGRQRRGQMKSKMSSEWYRTVRRAGGRVGENRSERCRTEEERRSYSGNAAAGLPHSNRQVHDSVSPGIAESACLSEQS